MAFLAFSIIVCLVPAVVVAAPTINFSFGQAEGVDQQAQDTRQPYYAYYGIPFAEPPVGNRRFLPPVPYQSRGSNTVITSRSFRSGCIQMFPVPGLFDTSEDCLYLNVFTPSNILTTTAPKKVLVWIHGGGFLNGDAVKYIPSRLVTDYDVIVVTLQYRLNLFGFMSSGKGDGNLGLRDQILALKWVKANIGQFGGDGNDITVFGLSAGAASVSFLSLSPLSKGLFSKAIMMSGVGTADWPIKKKPEEQFVKFAEAFGCKTYLPYFFLSAFSGLREKYISDAYECLRKVPAEQLTKIFFVRTDLDFIYTPNVDVDVIPRDPKSMLYDKDYLRANGVLDRSYIAGFANNDGILELTVRSSDLTADYLTGLEDAGEFIKEMTKRMYPYSEISNRDLDLIDYQYSFPRPDKDRIPLQGLLDIATDTVFAVPILQFVRALTDASPTTNVYMYLFDHYPQLRDPNGIFKGSNHALDELYVFDFDERLYAGQSFYAVLPSPGEEPLYDAYRGAITTFAKTGNPARGINQAAEPKSWPRYDREDEYYLAISVSPEVRQRVYAKRMALWTEVLRKINKCPSYGYRLGCDERSLF